MCDATLRIPSASNDGRRCWSRAIIFKRSHSDRQAWIMIGWENKSLPFPVDEVRRKRVLTSPHTFSEDGSGQWVMYKYKLCKYGFMIYKLNTVIMQPKSWQTQRNFRSTVTFSPHTASPKPRVRVVKIFSLYIETDDSQFRHSAWEQELRTYKINPTSH